MIIYDLIDYVDDKEKYTDITADILREGTEAICFVQLGSTIGEDRYLDKSYTGIYEFEIRCKSKSIRKALNQLDYYRKLFYINSEIVLSDNLHFIQSEPITDCRLLYYTDQNEAVYGITIKIEYYEK